MCMFAREKAKEGMLQLKIIERERKPVNPTKKKQNTGKKCFGIPIIELI
jgi:hypothetical protein